MLFQDFIGGKGKVFFTMESIEFGDIPRLSAISLIVLHGFLLILSHTTLIFFGVCAVFGRPVLGQSLLFSNSLYLLIVS